MKIIITKDYEELSAKALEMMKGVVVHNPYAVLGLATGTTPLGLYAHMIADHVSIVREQLQAGAKSVRYGYIFKTLAALCEVMEIKYDLGVRTRKAYREHNATALKALLSDYSELEKRLKKFCRLFAVQWEKERKSYGFEKQDIRMGGLSRRVAHCRSRLSEYLDGKRGEIEELEENILPVSGEENDKHILFNQWLYTSMIKPMM